MGAVFFMAFLAILFFVAVFFILASIVIIAIWKTRKRKGKNPKKWWLVIPTALLIINVLVAMLPVGYIGFLRFANSTNRKPVIYAKSEIMLVWPMGEHESTQAYFEMDGIKYIRFRESFSNDSFFLDYGDERLGEPVANIKNNPAASNAFNEFMTWLLTGSTTDKLSISTIFPIINDNEFELYHCNANSGINAYCPEEKSNSIKAYYSDKSNYDTENPICKYTVFASSEDWNDENSRPHNDIKRTIILKAGVFDELYLLYDTDQDIQRIEIPQKYLDISEKAVPGTPFLGYDERWLTAYSKDGLAYRHVVLALIDDKVYIERGSGYGYIGGYPLSSETNQYIIDNVFMR